MGTIRKRRSMSDPDYTTLPALSLAEAGEIDPYFAQEMTELSNMPSPSKATKVAFGQIISWQESTLAELSYEERQNAILLARAALKLELISSKRRHQGSSIYQNSKNEDIASVKVLLNTSHLKDTLPGNRSAGMHGDVDVERSTIAGDANTAAPWNGLETEIAAAGDPMRAHDIVAQNQRSVALRIIESLTATNDFVYAFVQSQCGPVHIKATARRPSEEVPWPIVTVRLPIDHANSMLDEAYVGRKNIEFQYELYKLRKTHVDLKIKRSHIDEYTRRMFETFNDKGLKVLRETNEVLSTRITDFGLSKQIRKAIEEEDNDDIREVFEKMEELILSTHGKITTAERIFKTVTYFQEYALKIKKYLDGDVAMTKKLKEYEETHRGRKRKSAVKKYMKSKLPEMTDQKFHDINYEAKTLTLNTCILGWTWAYMTEKASIRDLRRVGPRKSPLFSQAFKTICGELLEPTRNIGEHLTECLIRRTRTPPVNLDGVKSLEGIRARFCEVFPLAEDDELDREEVDLKLYDVESDEEAEYDGDDALPDIHNLYL